MFDLSIQKEWLRNQYVTLGKPIHEIAELANLSEVTVSAWLKKHGIVEEKEKSKEKRGELRQRVILKIKKNKDILDGLTINEIVKKHRNLYILMWRNFETVDEALDLAGVNYKRKNIELSDEELLNRVKSHYSNPDTVLKAFPEIERVRFRFNGIDNALKMVGLPPSAKLKKDRYRELLIKEIQNNKKELEGISLSQLNSQHKTLYSKCYVHFKNVREAFESAGVKLK